jgi:hypothetical protein
MHNPATHSAVSDALIALARSNPGAQDLATARRVLDAARSFESELARNAESPIHGLDDARSTDLRITAWKLGSAIARRGDASLDTPVVAAAVPAGALTQATDDDIAAAVAIGTLAADKLLKAVDSAEFRARWNVVSSLGVVGATLAVGRLLRLDDLQMRNALGVAATQAAGLARNNGEPMSALETGKAAADAIESALLAKHGFTSAAASIDGRRGLAALMAYRFDASAIESVE